MPKPHVALRINCPLPLYEKIGAYRHEARHETRAQAMTTLLAAGLAALAKPPALPVRSAVKSAEAQRIETGQAAGRIRRSRSEREPLSRMAGAVMAGAWMKRRNDPVSYGR